MLLAWRSLQRARQQRLIMEQRLVQRLTRLGPACRPLVAHWGCGASLFGKAALTRRVMKAAGAPAMRTVSVGDELRDLDVARTLGLDFIAVAWGYTAPARFAGLPGVLR